MMASSVEEEAVATATVNAVEKEGDDVGGKRVTATSEEGDGAVVENGGGGEKCSSSVEGGGDDVGKEKESESSSVAKDVAVVNGVDKSSGGSGGEEEKKNEQTPTATDEPAVTKDTEEEEKKKADEEEEEEEEAPKIFLRPFSEIRERGSSDEEDDDDVVFVGEEVKKVVSEDEARLARVRERLGRITTTDEALATVQMGFAVGGSAENNKDITLGRAGRKLALFVNRKRGNVMKPQQQQQPNWIIQQSQTQQRGGNRLPQQQNAPVSDIRTMLNTNMYANQQNQQQQRLLQPNQVNIIRGQQHQLLAPNNNSNAPTQFLFDPKTGEMLYIGGGQGAAQLLQAAAAVQQQSQQQQPRILFQPQQQARVRQQQPPPPPPVFHQTRLVRPNTYNRAPAPVVRQRAPPPPKPLPRVNNGVVPVRLPLATSNSAALSSVVATTPAKGAVTAGNQKPIPGTVDDESSGMENKTFPSLVVHVKTCLGKDGGNVTKVTMSKARSELDSTVKQTLTNTPAQFTECLMRKGILRLEHTCDSHRLPLKLGMYTDESKQPFSGGYVWTSDCCGDKQVSVFGGSIFEGSKYPPGTVLKLVYHWSCQTPAANVLQWVKVSSMYLKNFYTLLRAICIGWLHELCPLLGGENRFVEIGVITLGSSAETSRGVKNVNVEILGVFDPLTKIIRMKVINSMQSLLKDSKSKDSSSSSSSEQGARAFQILWPLTHWVDKRSVLLVDGIIDKALFHELGFKNVQQCRAGGGTNNNNTNVMNYLRSLVPKMFSSTLSVLSKSIVQQFLDELSWREMHGQTVLSTYNHMLDHIGSMTKWNAKDNSGSLITRLNKINQNPFVDWSYSKGTRRNPMNTIPFSLRGEPGIRECVKHVMKEGSGSGGNVAVIEDVGLKNQAPKQQPPPPQPQQQQIKQPPAMIVASNLYNSGSGSNLKRKQVQDEKNAQNMQYYKAHFICNEHNKELVLQSHYYGRREGSGVLPADLVGAHAEMPTNLKCPLCTRVFTSKNEIARHLYAHVNSPVGVFGSRESNICGICLKDVPIGFNVGQHVNQTHKLLEIENACKICEEKFKGEYELTIHMWDLHNAREGPYRCPCGFASSFNYDVYQHFMEAHSPSPLILCPLCLKPYSVHNTSSLKSIITHFQIHANATSTNPIRRSNVATRSLRCPRCTLQFTSDNELDNHLMYHYPINDLTNWTSFGVDADGSSAIRMCTPPVSRNPIPDSLANGVGYVGTSTTSSSTATYQPPPKKQKTNSNEKKNKSTLDISSLAYQPPPPPVHIPTPPPPKKTLNVSIAVPIDTNEKFGGSRYQILLPPVADGDVVECGECGNVAKQGHYIGRLICTKCRYITACQEAMDLHHLRSHGDNDNKMMSKPVMKTKRVALLSVGEMLGCSKEGCGFKSRDTYALATHLAQCEVVKAIPVRDGDKQPSSPANKESVPPPNAEQPATSASTEQLDLLLGPEPVPTFDDILNFETSGGGASSFSSSPPRRVSGGITNTFTEPMTPCPAPAAVAIPSTSGGAAAISPPLDNNQIMDWDHAWDLESLIK